MTITTYPRYSIYKLTDPRGQVGLPGTHKWAVGVQYVAEQGFVLFDAFRTKAGAQNCISGMGHCILCGEKPSPLCQCEREAAGI